MVRMRLEAICEAGSLEGGAGRRDSGMIGRDGGGWIAGMFTA